MIKQERQIIRTDVESLFLEEMVDEDANFLIMGDDDNIVDDIIPDNVDTSLFDDASSDDIMDDEDDYIDDL